MTDVSVKILRRIKTEVSINQGQWNTPGKKRPRLQLFPTWIILIFQLSETINEFYGVKKQVPKLRSQHNELKEATLRKILHKNRFEFLNNKIEHALLTEKYDIAAWRHRFLRTIHKKRLEGKLIIYLDMYLHQNYKVKKSWQGPSTSGVTSKISSGKRHIIVHAGSEEDLYQVHYPYSAENLNRLTTTMT